MNEKALAVLIRLARAEAEARQIDVARLMEAMQDLDLRGAMLAAELEAERQSPHATAAAFGPFAARIKRARDHLAQQRAGLERQEAALRAVLAEAFLELKKLEQLQNDRASRNAKLAATRESAQMDAVAARMRRPA